MADLAERCCRVCKIVFTPSDNRQVSCSTACAHKAKPKHYKRHDLKRNYKITIKDWEDMFAKQNGCCKICNNHQSALSRALDVDHNHSTGKVRGLLCHKCNRALGLFNEDLQRMQTAIEYLKHGG